MAICLILLILFSYFCDDMETFQLYAPDLDMIAWNESCETVCVDFLYLEDSNYSFCLLILGSKKLMHF